MRVICSTLAVLLILGAAGGAARAQGKTDQDLAREHYDKGNTAYQLGRFDEAIAEFEAAYKLSKVPALLFNIAQAHRRKGDCVQAIAVYHNYEIAEPNPPNPTEFEQIKKETEACAAEQKANGGNGGTNTPPDHPVIPPKQPPDHVGDTGPDDVPMVPPSSPEGPASGHTKKLWGVVTMGAGVAFLATSGVFAYLGGKQHDDLQTCLDNPPCVDADSMDSHGKSLNTYAYITLGVGAAAAVTGGILYYMGMRADSAAEKISVAPLPGGAAVGYTVTF